MQKYTRDVLNEIATNACNKKLKELDNHFSNMMERFKKRALKGFYFCPCSFNFIDYYPIDPEELKLKFLEFVWELNKMGFNVTYDNFVEVDQHSVINYRVSWQ